MHELNMIDCGILGIVSLSVIFGLFRGFAREAISLFTWVAAITLGILYSEEVGSCFSTISAAGARLIIGFVMIVLVSLIVGGIINFSIGKLISRTKFNLPDRVMGSLFGLARGVFAVSVAILIVTPTILAEKDLWKGSVLIPEFSPLTHWIKERFPEDMLKDYMHPFEKNNHSDDLDKGSKPNSDNGAAL